MKKKVLLYGLLLGSATFLHAQSGIGIGVELPHGSTILDVEASDKGISLPNVALTSLTAYSPIPMEPKDGLLVFNTTENVAQLTKGFYYWGTLGTGKGWLPIAANQSVVLTKEGDDYYFTQGDTTLNLTEEISNVQRYALMVQQTEDENSNGVKLATKFNDGKEGSADVLLTETLTGLTRGKEGNTGRIAYTYTDETGEAASTKLTITSDVIESFEEIVKNEEVKNSLNNYLDEKKGSVKIDWEERKWWLDKPREYDDFVFTFDKPGETSPVRKTLSGLILDYVPLATITKVPTAEGETTYDQPGFHYEFNNGRDGHKVELKETVTTLERDPNNTIHGRAYNFRNEQGKSFNFNVTQDIIATFSTVMNSQAAKSWLIGYESGKEKQLTKIYHDPNYDPDDDPTEEGYFNRDLFAEFPTEIGGGNTSRVNFSEYVRRHQTIGFMDKIEPHGGFSGKGFTFDSKNELSPASFEFTETRTLLNRFTDRDWLANFEESGKVTQEVLENNPDYGLDLDSGFTYYTFQDESGAMRYMTVSQDVSNDFEKILVKNQTVLDRFIQEASGDIKIIKEGDDIVFVVKEGATEERINITQLIKDNSSVASLTEQSDTENTAKVGLALKFSDGKQTNPEELSFAETLTTLTKGVDDTTDLTEYTYTDEAGVPQTLAVSQDVSNDFSKIVNANQEVIKTIVGDYTGNIKIERVTGIVNEDGNPDFDVRLTFLDEEAPGNTVSAIKFINDNASIVQRPSEDAFAGIGKNVKFGLMIDGPDKNDKTYGSYTSFETLTKIEKDVAPNGHITYEYYDERFPVKNLPSAEWITYMPITQDVIASFKFAIANEENKALITNIVQESSANPWNKQGTTEVAKSNTDDIYTKGKVVIGGETMIENPKATNTKLSVGGDVVIDGKFFSTNSVYADYVFEKYFTGASALNLSYEFKSLDYVKEFVEKYNHLPGVTKISDVERTADGKYLIDFSELSIQQLEKIEELYLHTIEQQEEIDALKTAMDDLSKEVELLKASFQQFMHNSK